MINTRTVPPHLASFLGSKLKRKSGSVLKVRSLRGGLDSLGVVELKLQIQDDEQCPRHLCLVVKRIKDPQAREARIYTEIIAEKARAFSPALIGVQQKGEECWLYLEAIQPVHRWPWHDTAAAGEVLKSLARFHLRVPLPDPRYSWLSGWDYESELLASSQDTLRYFEETNRYPEFHVLRKSLPALRRVIHALPILRRQLFGFNPFNRSLIHGDVHSGNVTIRKAGDGWAPVFLDWGRARMGSPLEDVSSWLQSLGFWEPEARRRHDTLLGSYLQARGQSAMLSRDFRDAYWLAAASNLLGGAISYHLLMASGSGNHTSRRRAAALDALSDCMRVIRQADACWSDLWGVSFPNPCPAF